MHKILIITNDLEIGGIQKSLIDFLQYLSQKDFEVDLLLWQTDSLLKTQIPDSVNIIERKYAKTWKAVINERNPLTKIQYFSEYLSFNFFSKIVKKPWLYFPKITKSYKTVVSYSHNGYPRFYAIDKVIGEKKYLWYHHGSYENQGKNYDLDKKYYAKFNRLITVSKSNKNMLLEYFPELIDRISVVPNIINVEKIISDSRQLVLDLHKIEGFFNFVTVSRFSKEKGLYLSLEIAEEIKSLGIKFKWYFIGDGELFSDIKKIVLERDLEDVCILLGAKENPYPYMKLADFYIQTSFVESQSITVYEALALKKIIITTNLPALNEVLKNRKLGVLCNPDKISFVNGIKGLLYDDAAQDKFREALEKHEVKNDIAHHGIDELFEI